MFRFLRLLEAFGLDIDAQQGRRMVEAFVSVTEGLEQSHHPPILEDEEFFLKWYHVLSGLGRIATENPHSDVSKLAIKELFAIMLKQGIHYQEGAWRIIWRSIIFPLTEVLRGPGGDRNQFMSIIEWSVDLLIAYQATFLSNVSLVEVFDSKWPPLFLIE